MHITAGRIVAKLHWSVRNRDLSAIICIHNLRQFHNSPRKTEREGEKTVTEKERGVTCCESRIGAINVW